jgi:hypothetical protein
VPITRLADVQAMGEIMTDGRASGLRDTPDRQPVAVVTEAMVQRFWPGESGIGKRFRRAASDAPEVEIVGVVRDYKVRTPGESPRAMVHFAWRQRPLNFGAIAFPSSGPPERMLEQVAAAVLAVGPQMIVPPLMATTAPTIAARSKKCSTDS